MERQIRERRVPACLAPPSMDKPKQQMVVLRRLCQNDSNMHVGEWSLRLVERNMPKWKTRGVASRRVLAARRTWTRGDASDAM